MNRYYICTLPIYGTTPVVQHVHTARTKREAPRIASQLYDRYHNAATLPGHRKQRTPASHWKVDGPFFY